MKIKAPLASSFCSFLQLVHTPEAFSCFNDTGVTFVLLPEFVVVFDIGQQEFLTNWQSSLRRFSNFSMIFLAGIKHPHILATTGSEKGCW